MIRASLDLKISHLADKTRETERSCVYTLRILNTVDGFRNTLQHSLTVSQITSVSRPKTQLHKLGSVDDCSLTLCIPTSYCFILLFYSFQLYGAQ